MQDESTGTEIKEERREKEMSNIDKQLPAVINDTTVAVAMLEQRLEAVYNQIVGIGQINTNFTNLTNNFVDMSNHFTKVNNVMKNTSVQSSKVVSKVNNISLTMNAGAKIAKNYGNVFKSLASGFSHVVEAGKKIWAAMESTSDYLKVYNSYKDTFSEIAGAWSADYEKYGYENAEAYAESYTNRMNDTFTKLSGVQFDDKNMQIASNDVKNLGLSLQEVTKCATDLASVTSSIGFSGEESLASTEAFTKLAGDLSAKYDVDYSTISQNLINGIAGQTDVLGNYEIYLSDANLQNYATNLGIDESVADMSQAEQMQLRMIAILEQSKEAWGNLAISMEQPSVQLRMLKNNFTELMQTLGQLFMPLLQKILPFINGVTVAIKILFTNIAKILGINMKLSAQETNDVAQGFTSVSESAEEAGESVKKAHTHLLGIDQLNVVESDESTDSATNVKNSGVDLSSNLSGILGDYESMWEKSYADMKNKAQEFATSLGVIFLPIENMFRDIKIGDWFAVGEDVSNIVTGIYSFFATAIDSVDWKKLGENIGEFLAGIDWTGILGAIGSAIWEALKAVFELYVGIFDAAPVETALVTALTGLNVTGLGSVFSKKLKEFIVPSVGVDVTETLPAVIGDVVDSIGGDKAVTGLLSFIPSAEILLATTALAGFAIGLGVVFEKNEEVRESFSNAIDTLQEGLQPAMELFTNTILPGLSNAWNGLMEILSPFFTFMEDVFVSMWLDFINPALTMIGTNILPALTSVLETLWNSVLAPFGEFLGSVLAPIIQIISDRLSIIWQNVVVPLGDAIINVLGAAFVGLCDTFNYLIEPIGEVIGWLQSLWEEAFIPVIDNLWEKWLPIWEICGETIGGVIDGLGDAFCGLIEFLTGVFTADWDRAWKGVSEIFLGIFNGIISIVEGVVNIIIQGLNTFLASFEGVATSLGDVIGIDIVIPQISLVELPRFEVGGFPEDGLFMANHNELVGRFDNGKTVVANNEQIVLGIKGGVKDAVSEVLAPYLADIAENTRETANKDFATYIGDKEIARASERGRRAMGMQLITEL